VSNELEKLIQRAVAFYDQALALDEQAAREEATLRAVARADAISAYTALQSGRHAEAHLVAKYARSRNPDLCNPTHLRDSVWLPFELACGEVIQLSMREAANAREDAVRTTLSEDVT
jgi:hypothetical protein